MPDNLDLDAIKARYDATRMKASGFRAAAHDVSRLVAEVERLRAERDKLQAFKDWCHDYLDGKGVPSDPGGPHSAEGCRIGDRMDCVFAELERLREQDAQFPYEREAACRRAQDWLIKQMRTTAVNCGARSSCAVAHWCKTSEETE